MEAVALNIGLLGGVGIGGWGEGGVVQKQFTFQRMSLEHVVRLKVSCVLNWWDFWMTVQEVQLPWRQSDTRIMYSYRSVEWGTESEFSWKTLFVSE